MLLQEILEHKDALFHLERFVNKGSPSGFTKKYTVSERYHPLYKSSFFDLPCLSISPKKCRIFPREGLPAYNLFSNKRILFPIHPDMVLKTKNVFKKYSFDYQQVIKLKAVPTASMRTLYVKNGDNEYYLKLHYDGIIGRISRKLPYIKAIAGVELSRLLTKSKNNLPDSFSFMQESSAITTKFENDNDEIGFITREVNPFPIVEEKRFLIPFFSLTSRDLLAKDDPILLSQIIEKHQSLFPIFKKIIELVIESYFYLVFTHGLIPEINAQNILLEVDSNFYPKRIVLRDLMGWEKDLSIRESLGLCNEFASFPYKCIKNNKKKLYYIRHSFSYDFKLSYYIIDEIVNTLSYEFNLDKKVLVDNVVEIVEKNISEKRESYFQPQNRWYSHPKCLLTQFRPYIEHLMPKYRRANMNTNNRTNDSANVKKAPALKKGDCIGIIAPSEPITDERWLKLEEGIELFKSLGFKVKLSKNLRKIDYYMAGSPQQRASDFNDMIIDADVQVIWTGWGGKSANQILDLIDWENLAINPKIVVGFSDTTNLINATYSQCNLVSFHGPHVAGKIASCPQESIDSFLNAFMSGKVNVVLNNNDIDILRKGQCVGKLIGGNLKSFVLSNLNTPYSPEAEGSIFFWETGSGTPQEIDQYLTYLHLTGFFNKLSGMVVGDLSNCKDKRDWGGKKILEVVKSCTKNYNFPIIHIETFGHGNIINLTFPVGCKAKIDTEKKFFNVIDECVEIEK